MKINVNNYAKILYEALEGKPEKASGVVIKNFIKLLAGNNHLKYWDRIVAGFNGVYNKKHGIIAAEAITKKELDNKTIKKLQDFLIKKHNVKEVELTNIIDSDMLGGIILKTDNEMIDGSADRQIAELKQWLIS